MNLQQVLKNNIYKTIICIGIFFSISYINADAQTIVKGKILTINDAKPIAFASIKLINRLNGSVSDTSGHFSLTLRNVKKEDTLLISSIGYEDLKLAVRSAISQSEFKLKSAEKTLKGIIIKSFSQEEITGTKSEIIGYFRSWNNAGTGGEIGRSFIPEHKEYQISKVRFKVYNTYDTCLIRLRIREMENGEPGREILRDSVAQVLGISEPNNKSYEFDLNKYNLILSQKNIFVSFEVLKEGQTDNTLRSLSFVGSEAGSYFYKSNNKDSWNSSAEYTIYMKLLLKYDD